MKTKNSVLSSLRARLAHAGLQAAAALAMLVLFAGNLSATTVTWITGGPGAGYEDGDLTSQAYFNNPNGLAMDLSGNYLLVADQNNNAVRLIQFNINNASTLLTYTNYVQAENLFTQPISVAIDPNYNIFVLCRGTGKNGYVMEFDYTGELIATNLSSITNAGGMAIDGNDDIFVTASNKVFEVFSATGAVTNLTTITAPNSSLQGIVVKHNGLLAVCDTGRNGILLINPGSGTVTTNAGFHGVGDFVTVSDFAYSNTATFNQPSGIAESGDGTLIVTDYGNNRVKAVLANGNVTNVYGISSTYWTSPYPGFQDGTVALPDNYGGVAGREEHGIVLAPDGSLYVSEDYYDIIRHVTGAGFVPQPTPPNPPASLSATIVTNSGAVGVLLQWSGSQGATNYLVERSTSTNSFSLIGVTAATSFTDTNVTPGFTYYYAIQAEGNGGISTISPVAGITIPVPPPPAPNIGWYDFEGDDFDGYFSTMHPQSPGNPYIAHNPLNIAIDPTVYNGVSTYYITSPPYPTNSSASFIVGSGSTPPVYENDQRIGSINVNPLPSLSLSNGVVTIQAVNVNGVNEDSGVASASFEFAIGNPILSAPNGGQLNAAQFTISDVSTNVVFYYTLDGTDPTNAPSSQQVFTTNGIVTLSLNGSTNINFEVRAIGYGPEANYLMSGITSWQFTPGTFVPNEISWGFASGQGSSEFIGAAGQNFVAPVTLTMLPGINLYSLQFNMTVSSTGPGITNPAPPAGPFSFQSMLMQPVPDTQPQLYTNIPPLALASEFPQDEDTNYVYYNGQQFVNLTVSNGNELAVGWAERAGFTNLYNTKGQTLTTYSEAHDTLYPSIAQGQPNGVFAGGYMFQLSSNALNGEQYQIELSRASGTSDGIGAPGNGVEIYAADLTNSASLAPGTLSGIKNVTVGSIPYLVGNVYPFRWFNAGDFGNSNLQSADIEQVLQSAIYGLDTPPFNPLSTNASGGYTIVSDMYDAEDSCGQLGYLDNNPTDQNYGYYTNAGPLTLAEEQQLFNGDYSLINHMAFGDGKLDISDVYLTFLRSEFTNDFIWFQRIWTNGVRVANAIWAPGVIPPGQGGGGVGGGQSQPAAALSITNTPIVNFTATDFVASAGQTISIPVNATVFGPYPMRMVMLNMSVVPLDGSPAITSAINFSPNSSMNTAFGSSTPYYVNSSGPGNYSAAWLPATPNVTQLPGFANTANLGTLTVTIPTNATSMSAYAVHFDTASASPSGLLSFPSRTFTGLITLCSRTNSYYSDGIPDSWRLRYFGTIYNQLSVSNADADGTSFNNWQKYCAGINPVDGSVLNEGADQAMAQNPQDMVLYWPSVNNQTYIIKRSSTLFPPHWTSISTNIGNGTYMEIHDTNGGSTRFYEVTTP